jgi:hypothetical protein
VASTARGSLDMLRENQLAPAANKSDSARTLAKHTLLCLEIRKYTQIPIGQTCRRCGIGPDKSACGTRRAVVAASFFPDHGQSTWRVLKDM